MVTRLPQVAVDRDITLRAWWDLTNVSTTGDEVFQARLSPSNGAPVDHSRYVQMTGLGFAYVGSQGGHSYAGPGVDQPWDLANNTYQVSFKFTGERLGLLVSSPGGRWRVLVDGSVAGGIRPLGGQLICVPRARRGLLRRRWRAVADDHVQLSRGAWLAGIGTDAASDSVSPPATSYENRPSEYWLGDSYVMGSGARDQGFDDFVHVASEQAGVSNVTVDALGGTGYRKSNPAAKFPDYLARARLNLRAGRATPISSSSAVDHRRCLQRGAGPFGRRCTVCVSRARGAPGEGCRRPIHRRVSRSIAVEHAIDGVLAAARAAPNVIGVLNLPEQVLARSGNQPVARLSVSLASTTVEYHPSPAAQKLYGEIIGQFLTKIIRRWRVKGG